MVQPYYERDGITIYHGDCQEVLPTLVTAEIDLVCTDPPYGMDWDGKVTRGPNGSGKRGATRNYGVTIQGDTEKFDPSPWLAFPRAIFWGFQHFNDAVPNGTVLVWVKRYDSGFGSFLSDADTAWMKGGHGVYCFRDLSLQAESSNRAHPTQKPVPLMKWCISKSGSTTGVVLNPFMGSGTTLRAAKDLGRRAIGIELEERFCEIAAKRLQQEVLALGGVA